jgi:hypothetical protein
MELCQTSTPLARAAATPGNHGIPYESGLRSSSGSDAGAAVEDLKTLSPTFLHDLADLWFKETQLWFPILNWQHSQVAFDSLPSPFNRIGRHCFTCSHCFDCCLFKPWKTPAIPALEV